MGTCPSSPVCPTHNQCTYTANNIPFAFACGVEYIGGQLPSVTVPSIAECISLCSTTPHCAAVSFANAVCSLQNESGVAVLNPYATSAYTYSSNHSCIPAHFLQLPSFSPDLSAWTQTFHGLIRPNTSDAAFIGVSRTVPWAMTLTQHMSVTPRRSYTISVRSRQDVVGNCACRVLWRGEELIAFMPREEYDDRSVLFAVGEAIEGEVGIGFECDRGGEGKGVYLDSVSVEVVRAG